ALEAFWEGAIPGISSAEELMKPGLILQFGRPPNRIDLINQIEGVTFEKAWPSKRTAILELDGQDIPVHYLGLESLIQNKRLAGRPKDLDDLAYLIKAAQRQQE
ncbi:MAG: hypothetical protein V3T83_19060, partial [Acidobacteriota bacterium]